MQVARVAISNELWRAFRQLALARDKSVSAYLGLLVAAELKRRKATPVDALGSEASETEQAMEALGDARSAIGELASLGGSPARRSPAARRGKTWQVLCASARAKLKRLLDPQCLALSSRSAGCL